jgi:hypothetical protein
MSFQSQFRRFHEAILLKRFQENAELRDKREKILKRLRENLPAGTPSFEPFNQGSYEMGTGIKPLDKDYDIDIGILFDVDHRKHAPVVVKGWVYNAVQGHTARVEWRRPCITVYYQEGGEPKYHVDLAIMAKDVTGGHNWLAIGKQNSGREHQEWQPDDRVGFSEAVDRKFSGEEAAQFRRVIRYLKRWKDVHFSSEGRAAPTGLGLTVAAFYWFRPTMNYEVAPAEYDDLGATTAVVNSMLLNFGLQRLSLRFPNAPHDDVFARMTDQQMVEFRQRLDKFRGWLEEARRNNDLAPLRRAFGDAFPAQ